MASGETHRAGWKKRVMKGCGAAATAKLLLPVSTRMFICKRAHTHTHRHLQQAAQPEQTHLPRHA